MSLQNQKQIVVVLGMHRSGTSALTRALLAMGAGIGDNLLPTGHDNPTGFWEDRDFVTLNDRLLAMLDAGYDSLALLPDGFEQRSDVMGLQLEAVVMLREKLQGYSLFVSKDPRTCRLLPFWQQVFRQLQLSVAYVVAVRHPLSVVDSLSARNQFPKRKSLWLWLQHYVAAINGTQGAPRLFVDYDQLLVAPEQQLQRIAAALQLPSGDEVAIRDYADNFLSKDLRHATYLPEDIQLFQGMPEPVIEAYRLLLDATVDDENTNFAANWKTLAVTLKGQSEMLDFLQEYDRLTLKLKSELHITTQQLERERQQHQEERSTLEQHYKTLRQQAQREHEQAETHQAELAGVILQLENSKSVLSEELTHVYASTSWHITQPLRGFRRLLGKLGTFTRRSLKALGYVVRGDLEGLRNRRRQIQRYELLQNSTLTSKPECWGVMTTPHTLFVAHLIASRLRAHGWEVDILTGEQKFYSHDMYVVICPQIFKGLPPGERRIIYQMEQSVSSRWFTGEYIKTLQHSRAVLEYALVNVEFLADREVAYPHVYYLPVGADAAYMAHLPHADKDCEVLFYGDPNSSLRRRKMLDTLCQHFNVRICSEIFGLDMIEQIRSARVVINLHYYENALLEMPRIQECLSLGTPVVSESSRDQDDYPEISGAVTFFEQGNEQAMLDAVRNALKQPVSSETVNQAAVHGNERFTFMFDRFLVAMGFIPTAKLADDGLPLPFDASRIALSMPETIARRRIFEANRPQDCAVFDGVRISPAWVGCGLSYASLARHALQHGIGRLTVLEDDALLPDDFEAQISIVQAFLDGKEGSWDLFAGVIADLHDGVKILDVETFQGIRFVTIDKMTSMVCNIYSEKALRILAAWDPDHRNNQTNTIDRHLERQASLRVVVALPFLVGHREEVSSTLWGFNNSQYNDLINASEKALFDLVELHCKAQSLEVSSFGQ